MPYKFACIPYTFKRQVLPFSIFNLISKFILYFLECDFEFLVFYHNLLFFFLQILLHWITICSQERGILFKFYARVLLYYSNIVALSK